MIMQLVTFDNFVTQNAIYISNLQPYHILHIVWTAHHYIHVSKKGRRDSVALNLRNAFRQIP